MPIIPDGTRMPIIPDGTGMAPIPDFTHDRLVGLIGLSKFILETLTF